MSQEVFARLYTLTYVCSPQKCQFYYSIEFINSVLNDSQSRKHQSTINIYKLHTYTRMYIYQAKSYIIEYQHKHSLIVQLHCNGKQVTTTRRRYLP